MSNRHVHDGRTEAKAARAKGLTIKVLGLTGVLATAAALLLSWQGGGAEAQASQDKAPRTVAAPSMGPTNANADEAMQPLGREAFDQACRQPVMRKLYGRAAKGCQRFLQSQELEGQAHAMLSAIYTTPTRRNVAASVEHARRASALGDARGRFMRAAHLLAGYDEAVDPTELETLLLQAQRGGVSAARLYLGAVGESLTCAQHTSVRPLGLPVFCLFRGELLQALQGQGMRLRHSDDAQWTDQLAPKDALETASTVTLEYDVNPREEIHRLARLSYVFDTLQPEERWRQLLDGLRRKYGEPAAQRPMAQATWPLDREVSLVLTRAGEGRLEVRYEHTVRLRGRQANLASLEQTRQEDLLVAEWQAF